MKKFYFFILPFTILAGFLLKSHSAYAFNANDLMDDRIFDNANSMSSASIDSWLNSNFPSSCISTNHGFTTPDPTGYSPNPSQFFYSSTPVSAGTAIYDAAQAYGINPQVLLATLDKEESLVTGGTGCATWQYTSAVGYGCTDSGTNTHNYSYPGGGLVTPLYYINNNPVNSITNSCVNSGPKAGFSEQIIHAAWLLAFSRHKSEGDTGWAVIKGNWDNCDDNDTCPAAWNIPASEACYSGFMTEGTFDRCPTDTSPVYYDGYTTIDGTSVHMDTGATAAFYVYTPHFSGNQNFVNIFTSWFGKTTGPDYAWSIDSFTFNPVMGVGDTQTVTLKATNTGRLPWYNINAAPNTPMRIGTWPAGRSSPFANGSWVNSIRPANMTENVVQSGQDGTFTFQLTAPTATGTYVEGFNLLMENYQWLPWSGLSPTIKVVNPYQWQINSVNYSSGTGYMAPGSIQTITVKALNTGTATWTNNGASPIKLGTWQPGRQTSVGSGWPSSIRAAIMTEASVAPGQAGTFTFNVYMPDSGQHYERFNLVAEGTTWFNDAGLTIYLQGQSLAWQPLWYSPSTGNWTMQRGTNFVLTIQAKNTGSATWYKSGSFPVRLGTDDPQNRGSALYTPSWINGIRPTGLVQDSVPPGGEGTFTFNAVAPNTPGTRFEAFNLLAEGILWFNDPGFGVKITSL